MPFRWTVMIPVLALACSARSPETPSDGSGGVDGGVSIRSDAGSTHVCEPGEPPCGAGCCAIGEVCGVNGSCCTTDELCGSTCCGHGEVCEGAVCRIECGAQSRCTDESGSSVCCGASEVCAVGGCFRPEVRCREFFECPQGHYCDHNIGHCLPQPGGQECVARPNGGEVAPTLLWHWDGSGAVEPAFNQVMMSPMVANLDDDDGNGRIDEDDIPDVVFSTFCGDSTHCIAGQYQSNGILRAVSGRDGSTVFDVSDPALRVLPGAQVALGDIDGDSLVEIVTCGSDEDGVGPLIAFENDGTFKWRSADPRVSCSEAGPSIADLDGDGNVEVFVRYTVVNGRDGSVVWHEACAPTWREFEHNPCDYTTAADLSGDGRLEIVGGNVAFHADGSVYYDRRADFTDGYPAIGDLDGDHRPEVVVVHSRFHPYAYQGDHYLRALRADGSLAFGPIDLNQGLAPPADIAEQEIAGGGPPTIANFDDDPEPEIGVAGAYGYVVFEPNGTLRWSSITDDRSSRKTGSSVFDFDGDGVAEVLYNDHAWLRVYDGPTGEVRFCMCNTSATLWEYPVVVDVNNDAHAEIVLASNDVDAPQCGLTPMLGACERARITAGEARSTHGIRVFGSPTRDWVATRRIWNQHTYHVTNVTESGGIPNRERPNWLSSLNNFRQNIQPGASNIADVVPRDLAVSLRECPTRVTLHFIVMNAGWAAAPANVPVTVFVEEGGAFVRLDTVHTTRRLFPGESEALSLVYHLGARVPEDTLRFRVVINDPEHAPLETLADCRTTNDSAQVEATCATLF